MKLTARHDHASVEVEGDSEDLRQFAHEIRDASEARIYHLHIPSVPAAPYAGYLSSIRLEPAVGSVCLSLNGDQLVVRGSRDKLGIFADNVDVLSSSGLASPIGATNDHLHVEYHPGHFYLDEKSIPFVLAKRAGKR